MVKNKNKLNDLVEELSTVDNHIADLQSELDIWHKIRRNLLGLDEEWSDEELLSQPVV